MITVKRMHRNDIPQFGRIVKPEMFRLGPKTALLNMTFYYTVIPSPAHAGSRDLKRADGVVL